jgi:hypothetical protein
MDVTAGYTHFIDGIDAATDAELLAYADRLAEKARLLRKGILNKTVVSTADTLFTGTGGAFTPGTYATPEAAHQTAVVLAAAKDCFKAANNDV